MKYWNYIKPYFITCGFFLLVNIATIFIIWNTNPFINCNIFGERFWQNSNLLIENIINILKPSWPLTALIVGILFIFNFKESIATKINDIISIKKGEAEVLFSQNNNPKNEAADPNFPVNTNINTEYTEPKDLDAVKDEIKRLKVIVDDALMKNSGNKDQILQELIRTLAINNFRLHCEMWYRYIYGGQIRLLKLLKDIPDGINWKVAKYYFEKEVEGNPEIKKYQPDEFGYVSFLKSARFCDINNDQIIITNIGLGFLQWLEENNFTENNRIF